MEIKNFKINKIEVPIDENLQETPLSVEKTWDVADGKELEIGGIYYKKEPKSIVTQIIEDGFNRRVRDKNKMYICVQLEKGIEEVNIISENTGLDKKLVLELLEEIKEENRDSSFYKNSQQIRKIRINSFYGALANEYFHLANYHNACNITLSGQHLIKFISDFFNAYFKDVFYKNKKYFPVEDEKNKILEDVVVLIDTDSVLGDTMIDTTDGKHTIENLFDSCVDYSEIADKKYAYPKVVYCLSYDEETEKNKFDKVRHIVKHKVKKEFFELVSDCGKKVVVTEDEGIIVNRNEKYITIEPKEIRNEDELIFLRGIYDM